MKKSIVFILGALLALGACTKTAEMSEGTSDSKALKFRLAVNTPTKGDVAYKGSDASELNQNVVFASVRKDNGEISQKSVFWDNNVTPSIPSAGSFEYSSDWRLTDGSNEFKYLPKGSLMDMVVLGRYKDNFDMSPYYLSSSISGYSDYLDAIDHGFPSSNDREWTPYVFEDSKSIDGKVYFIGVDTYKDQVDVVYSVENNIAPGESRTVTLKHAQALININVQFLSEVPDFIDNMCLAFIGANTSFSNTSYPDYSTMKDYILGDDSASDFVDVMSHFTTDAESDNLAYYDDYLPLKTVGSFLIDNSLNTPVVRWQFPKLSEADTWNNLKDYNDGAGEYEYGGYAVLSNKETNYSEFNSSVSDYFTVPMDLLDALNSGNSIEASTYYQAAGQLIPEQKIVNPWIYFTIDGKAYLTEVNLPKGVWQAGHVYTYNLTLSFNGPKFTVEVKDYESPIESLVSTL